MLLRNINEIDGLGEVAPGISLAPRTVRRHLHPLRTGDETAMSSICWKSAVTWSLLGLMFLLFVLMGGPAPALAKSADAVLYEVTEDMYLLVRDTNGKVTSY